MQKAELESEQMMRLADNAEMRQVALQMASTRRAITETEEWISSMQAQAVVHQNEKIADWAELNEQERALNERQAALDWDELWGSWQKSFTVRSANGDSS